MPRKKFNVLAQHLQEIMEESLPKMVDDRVKEFTKIQVPDDPYDDAHLEGENSEKRQKTSEHGTYVFGESSSGQVNKSKSGPSTLGNQQQLDDFDFLTDSYATYNDELPTEKVSQELVEEMSQTVDEVKLHKVVNEMLRQQCTSGNEHQYHIDQMQKFLRNNIVLHQKYSDMGKSIKKYKMFSIVSKPVYGIIYKNNKKEKRVMRHQEVHKLCDATLKRVLEGLKSYNNDVKHGYVTSSLSKEDVEYLQLFEEEIKEQLKHCDQMRRWEILVVVSKDIEVSKGKGLLGPKGKSCGGKGGRGGGGGFMVLGAKSSRDSKNVCGEKGGLRKLAQRGLSLWLWVKSVLKIELVLVEEKSKVVELTLG
uniref:Uncharacterized protein n=1 Tax=Tanacetum cinerariifolium TaxID=118510 RepID=A0A6L2NLC3_TANCI|nr:hypothetical protein [Tanacetum cinerariifolium]